MKTMTLNLSEKEMEVLESLAKQKHMTKTCLLRQALRCYQAIDVRISSGARIFFSDDMGKRGEMIIL